MLVACGEIRDDRVDILVDLTLHMHGCRLLTFAAEPAPVQAAAPSLSVADRDAILGNYTLQLPTGQTLPIKFFLDGTRVMAQAQGQDANEIRYLGNYEFGVAFDPALRFTFTIEGGKATKVTLLQGGARVEGPRVP